MSLFCCSIHSLQQTLGQTELNAHSFRGNPRQVDLDEHPDPLPIVHVERLQFRCTAGWSGYELLAAVIHQFDNLLRVAFQLIERIAARNCSGKIGKTGAKAGSSITVHIKRILHDLLHSAAC